MHGFETMFVETDEVSINVSRGGSGRPVLLLHGFPQTSLMWRDVAPLLSRQFTVVCADLRGYGASGCPPSAADHAPYSKRAMAQDMVTVMDKLGFGRFVIAGHDRGGRVAYRAALDHPERVDKLAVLDVLPIDTVWDRANAEMALAFWPWSLLSQPEPLPERLLASAPDAIIDHALSDNWGTPADTSMIPSGPPTSPPSAISTMPTRYARSTGLRPRSTASTTPPTVRPGDGFPARCLHSGAAAARSRPGTPAKAARWRSGANSPATSTAARSMAGTSSPKNTPRRLRPP
jgi:pimeloyl-ACP methyl ester carboxylesterase